MQAIKLVLSFESLDEIIWCDHSNETSSTVFHIVLFIFKCFTKRNLGFVLNFDFRHSWE